MNLLGRAVFALVRWRARNGLAGDGGTGRRTGIRGETYAYWFLRRQGYLLVARNYQIPGLRGEVDLVGYDGPQLAFVEVKTRTAENAEPELAVTAEKQRLLTRMARRFLAERHIRDTVWRFDVVAIRSRPGRPPDVRLYKGAFGEK
ncbi:MAG TPA: YraN family protein [Candidatus Dormibacteraeota bacterium]|nr:YraN family protein [Candidatus Dormibacteraeota bacterium]